MKRHKLIMICAAAAAMTALAAVPAVSYAAEEPALTETGEAPDAGETTEPTEGDVSEKDDETAPTEGNVSEKDDETDPADGEAIVTTGETDPTEGEEKEPEYQWEGDDDGRIFCYHNGERLTGVQNIEGYDYLFSDNGVLKTGWRTVNGKRYCYSSLTGEIIFGWIEYNDNLYYVDEEKGKVYGAYIAESGIGYNLDYDFGYLVKQKGFVNNINTRYYSNPDGTLASGRIYDEGKPYIFDEDTYQQKTGFQIYDGTTYYYYPETGELADGFFRVDDKWYYSDVDEGVRLGDFVVDEVSYSTDDNCAILTGWLTSGKGIRYLYDDTFEFAKGITEIDGSRYIFSNDGYILTGRVKYDGNKYFVGEDGVIQTGFISLDDGKYYFAEDGVMATGWQTIEGNRYYFDENGKMFTGRVKIDGNKYYISDEGIVQTGLITLDDGTYLFNANGVMQTGLQTYEGKVYYFDESGKMKTNYSAAGYRFGADGVGVLLSDVQKKADALIAKIGNTVDAVYNYVIANKTYSHIEDTKTRKQIEAKGWSYFANYTFNNNLIVCYYFAAFTDLLFQQCNLESRIVYGNGRGTGDHYWNQVKINGVWKNYDTCNNFKGVSDDYLKKAGNKNSSGTTNTGDGYAIYDYIYPVYD